jgi:ferric-dicitrate binding protein FerR (iron transport regulator)
MSQGELIMITRLSLYVAALSLFMATLVAAAPVREIAFVLKVVGIANIKTANADWAPLKKGSRVNSGDRIRTQDNALVSLVFLDDKTMMKIRANSDVEIKGEKKEKGVSKELYVSVGELWSKVTPHGAGYRVETPSGVAAVKGTEFYTVVDNLGQTFIFGVEGLVQLLNELGEVLVGKGQMGFAKKGDKPSSSSSGQIPDWALADEEQDLNIEFQNSEGQKKTLKIRFKKK